MDLLRILRPVHWIKNIFVFAALIFGRRLFGPVEETVRAFAQAMGAFVCFSVASSAMYVFNDIIDRRTDSIHPERRTRPIAAGRITVPTASVVAMVCGALALAGSLLLSPTLAAIILTYMALNERRKRGGLFKSSPYIPLECEGGLSKHIVAFARAGQGEAAVTIAPRFLTSIVREGEYALKEKWEGTTVKLPPELHGYGWKDAFTGQSVPQGKELLCETALASFPAAFLASLGPEKA